MLSAATANSSLGVVACTRDSKAEVHVDPFAMRIKMIAAKTNLVLPASAPWYIDVTGKQQSRIRCCRTQHQVGALGTPRAVCVAEGGVVGQDGRAHKIQCRVDVVRALASQVSAHARTHVGRRLVHVHVLEEATRHAYGPGVAQQHLVYGTRDTGLGSVPQPSSQTTKPLSHSRPWRPVCARCWARAGTLGLHAQTHGYPPTRTTV